MEDPLAVLNRAKSSGTANVRTVQSPSQNIPIAQRLIAEIGGAGGAAGGAAIGTAIAPGIGTLIGGGLGGLLGGFGGDVAERAVRSDQDVDLRKAAQTGLVDGIFGAGPLKLGRAAFGAGKALRGGSSLSKAITQGGTEGANFTLRGLAGRNAADTASNLRVRPLGLNKAQKTKVRRVGVGTSSDIAARHNIFNFDDIGSAIARQDELYNDAIAGIQGLSKDQVLQPMQKILAGLRKKAGTGNQQKAKLFAKELDNLQDTLPNILDGGTVRQLKIDFDDLVSEAGQLATGADKSVNKLIADSFRKTLNNADEVTGAAGKELQALRTLRDQATKNIEGGTGKSGFRATDFIAGVPGIVAAGPAGGLALAAAARGTATDGAATAGSKGFGALSRLLDNSAGRATTQRGLSQNAATNVTGANLLGQLLTSSPTSPANVNSPNQSNTSINTSVPPQQGFTIPPEAIQMMALNILGSGGSLSDVEELMGIIELVNGAALGGQASQEPEKLTETQQKREDVRTSIQNVEQLLDRGSINFGPVSSRIEGLKSVFNAGDQETLDMRAAVSNLASAIRLARSGAAVTATEEQKLKSFLPSENDSEQQLRTKLNGLKQLFFEEQQAQPAGLSSFFQ